MGDSINWGYTCGGFMMVNTDCDINPVLKHTEQQEDTDDVPVVHLFIGTASGGFLCIMVDDLRSVEEPAVFIQQGEKLSGSPPQSEWLL